MRIRLLKFAARRPLVALLGAIGLVGAAIATPIAIVASHPSDTAGVDAMAKNGRALIGRIWLDRYPHKPTDEVDTIMFFGGGIGVYEHGSQYKFALEYFEFERQGNAVEVRFLQDDTEMKTNFQISACTDDRNFDLCVDFDTSPRGPKRYYSWGSEDGMAQSPWSTQWKRGAEANLPR